MLLDIFFDRDPLVVAKDLLGKVIRVRHDHIWLSAMIVETEAYYLTDKGSHASLGYTEKRKALFMPAGSIYMYYARGQDSLNVSCHGAGNAVLIKGAIPHLDNPADDKMLALMHQLNPPKNNMGLRTTQRLCAGQTLLCKSLGLKVTDWDAKNFDAKRFFFQDIGYFPHTILQTTRLGIPTGRDEHLPYRFIDENYLHACTQKPKQFIKHAYDKQMIETAVSVIA